MTVDNEKSNKLSSLIESLCLDEDDLFEIFKCSISDIEISSAEFEETFEIGKLLKGILPCRDSRFAHLRNYNTFLKSAPLKLLKSDRSKLIDHYKEQATYLSSFR